MNEDDPNKPPSSGEQGGQETAKSVAPPVEEKSKAEFEAKPVTKSITDRPRRKRGIMRSFFSHIIVAALAVAGVGGYFHWEDLLSQAGGRVCAYEVLGRYGSSQPGDKPMVLPALQEKAGETVQPKQVPASEQSSEMKVDEKSDADKEVASAAAAMKADKPASAMKEDVPAAPKEQAKVATSVVAKADAPTETSAEAPAPNDAASAAKEVVAKPVEVAKVAEPVAAPKIVAPVKDMEASNSVAQPVQSDVPQVKIVKSTEKKTFETEWADARRAYWAGDAGAENAYLDLISQYPDKADIRGELGNIYIKAGDSEKAAAQFLDAGLIWVKSGDKDKVAKIISMLENISHEKAMALKGALANAG